MKRSRVVLIASAGCVIFLLLAYPAQASTAAADALRLCGLTLVPSLFPFYTAANFLLAAGLPPAGKRVSGWMRRLFGLPGEAAPALVLGLLGGYPVGASVTAELYRQGSLTKQEAVSLSRFANNAGPAFIIGAAGLAVFRSAKTGLLLYGIHILSALLTGLILRRNSDPPVRIRRSPAIQNTDTAQALPKAISASVQSMLMICAYVVFFSVVLAVIRSIAPIGKCLSALSVRCPACEAMLSGFAELSCGILSLQKVPCPSAWIAASVLLGWGGICVFFQSASVLSSAGLPARQCLGGKLTQSVIAGMLSCLCCALNARNGKYLLCFPIFVFILLGIVKFGGRKKASRLL